MRLHVSLHEEARRSCGTRRVGTRRKRDRRCRDRKNATLRTLVFPSKRQSSIFSGMCRRRKNEGKWEPGPRYRCEEESPVPETVMAELRGRHCIPKRKSKYNAWSLVLINPAHKRDSLHAVHGLEKFFKNYREGSQYYSNGLGIISSSTFC